MQVMILYHQQSTEFKLTLTYSDLHFNSVIWSQLKNWTHREQPSGLPWVCSSWPLTTLAYLLGLFYVLILASAFLIPAQRGLSCGTGPAGSSCLAAAVHLGRPLYHWWGLICPAASASLAGCFLSGASATPVVGSSPSCFLWHAWLLLVLAVMGSAAGTCLRPRTDKAKAQGKLLALPQWLRSFPQHAGHGTGTWSSWDSNLGFLLFLGEFFPPCCSLLPALRTYSNGDARPASCGYHINACEQASLAGPQAWPRFTWMLWLPPAYLPSTIAVLLGQVDSVASLYLPRVYGKTCLQIRADMAKYRWEEWNLRRGRSFGKGGGMLESKWSY